MHPMSTSELLPTEVTEEDVSFVLGLMEQDTSVAASLHKIGVDTELTKALRGFMSAPHEIFAKMNEQLAELFPVLFVKLLERNDLVKRISKIGIGSNPNSLSLWVFLKSDDYKYAVRGDVYEAHASLAGNAMFTTIRPHLLVLKDGEVNMPESFTELALT